MQKKNSHYAKQAIELLVKRVTIIDKTITLSLTTEGCLSLLVPRTRNGISAYTFTITVNLAA